MEFYILGMVVVPLVLAAVSHIIESHVVEDEEEVLPLSDQQKAA